jgi:hypothetical protein
MAAWALAAVIGWRNGVCELCYISLAISACSAVNLNTQQIAMSSANPFRPSRGSADSLRLSVGWQADEIGRTVVLLT